MNLPAESFKINDPQLCNKRTGSVVLLYYKQTASFGQSLLINVTFPFASKIIVLYHCRLTLYNSFVINVMSYLKTLFVSIPISHNNISIPMIKDEDEEPRLNQLSLTE